MQYIDTDKLYDLFTTVKLIKISVDSEQKIKRKKLMSPEPNLLDPKNLTPISSKIYESLTNSADRKKMLQDILNDDYIINKIEEEYEENDDLYEDELPSSVGFYIEHWLSGNIPCPVCNKLSLCIYEIPNMPVVDIVCTNPSHKIEDGVKFFQVKSRNIHSFFNKKPYNLYFSKSDNYIHTGSISFGYNSHIIKGTDTNKKILVGYICIVYLQEETTIKIDKKDSFILLPDVNNNLNESYYKYLTFEKKPVIQWNSKMNKIIDVDIKKIEITNLKEEIIPNNVFLKSFYGGRKKILKKILKYYKKINILKKSK